MFLKSFNLSIQKYYVPVIPPKNKAQESCAAPMEAATIAVNMIVISISAIFHEPFVGSRIIFSIGPAVETFKCAVI